MSNLFTRYINGDNINFKHAKGISDHSGKEFHLFHEIILFLDGDAELISETIHTKLKPETLIVIPKETYHQVVIHGKQDEYSRCVFQFFETPDNTDFINSNIQEISLTECDKNISFLFKKMMDLAKNPKEEFNDIIAESVLNLLIDEIRAKKNMTANNSLNDSLTMSAIDYISDNLTEKLNIDTIAQKLNISTSTLMHTFKKNMNISLHKYIIKKRLILAHAKISKGEPSSVVSIECGFKDYSGFYRQYKKMFDNPPSRFRL